jgi:ubiquinone biosynthesis protein UbiJ
MLSDTILGFLNHLLVTEDWARDRLQPFAGQAARFELGALSQALEISSAGLFSVGSKSDVPACVTIKLPADAPLRALTDRSSLFAAAHISGSAELAETLGFIFRNLRWDAESDLSRLVGDIAARRLVSGGRRLAKWHLDQARNLALNLAEYFTEESPAITSRQDVSAFCADVGRVQEDLSKLEKRVTLLES